MDRKGRTREENRSSPHDLNAEQAVIGSLLVSEMAQDVVFEKLMDTDFYSETHRVIFNSARKLYEKHIPIDQVTLSNELRSDDVYDRIGGREYIFEIVESVPVASNTSRYCDVVKSKSVLRSLIDIGTQVQMEAMSEPEDAMGLVDQADKMVFDLGNVSDRKSMVSSDALQREVLEIVTKAYDHGGIVTGIPTGYKKLDMLTTGWQKGDVIILAGASSMGKTAVALDFAQFAAEVAGKGVAIFNYEMSTLELGKRMLSIKSRIPLQEIRTGKIKDENWIRILNGTAERAELPIYFDDDMGLTVNKIRARLRRLKRQLERDGKELGLVVIDYLQLMPSDEKHEHQTARVGHISRQVKMLANEMQVPVVLLSQLSRGVGARADKRPILSDLRDSGAIEQDAALVIFCYRDEYYDEDSDRKGEMELIVAKQRNGPTGTVNLTWLSETATLGEMAHDWQQRQEEDHQ